MTATAANPRSEAKVRMSDLFPQMHFLEKLRATAICLLLLVPALTLVWSLAGPWDPLDAVTLIYHPRPWLALPVLLVYAGVGSIVATLLMGRRLGDFGVFAVGVGLAGLSLRGGDLSVLLQYHAGVVQTRGPLHGWLAVDVLLWTLVTATSCAVGIVTEAKADMPRVIAPQSTKPGKGGAETAGLPTRWLRWAAERAGTAPDWTTELRHGLMTLAVTAVIALVVIRMSSGRLDGPVHAGQVCFAVGLGFWLGAMAANQFCRPALSLWYCLAVPLVALIGHMGDWISPELPAGLARYSEIATMAWSGPGRPLPIDYLAIGPAAAILGIWTGHRVHRAREESAES